MTLPVKNDGDKPPSRPPPAGPTGDGSEDRGLEDRHSRHLDWRWFVFGCVMFAIAVVFAGWGFSLETLSESREQILSWILPLASGFCVWSFAGSVNDKQKGMGGLLAGAASGCLVWLITYATLFPKASSSGLNPTTGAPTTSTFPTESQENFTPAQKPPGSTPEPTPPTPNSPESGPRVKLVLFNYALKNGANEKEPRLYLMSSIDLLREQIEEYPLKESLSLLDPINNPTEIPGSEKERKEYWKKSNALALLYGTVEQKDSISRLTTSYYFGDPITWLKKSVWTATLDFNTKDAVILTDNHSFPILISLARETSAKDPKAAKIILGEALLKLQEMEWARPENREAIWKTITKEIDRL